MSTNSLQENKMGVMPEGRLLLNMALPMIVSMLVQALYNVVDSIFVSQVSESAVTALSLAFPIQNLQIGFAVGIGVGVNSLLSKSLGEGNQEAANRTAGNGFILMLIVIALFRNVQKYFTMEAGAYGMAFLLALANAYNTAGILRRPNASFYLSVILAVIFYLTRIKQYPETQPKGIFALFGKKKTIKNG